MVEAMGDDRELAENIILTTAKGSIVTHSSGIFIIKSIGLI